MIFSPLSRRFRALLAMLLPAALVCSVGMAQAEMATIEVYHLPLSEAAEAVKMQLSPSGSVATLPSRRMLIVNDDAAHLARAGELLKQLDQPALQYAATLEIIDAQDLSARSVTTNAALPGGWVRVAVTNNSSHSSSRRTFNLHLTANRDGTIETGRLQPYPQHIRRWLAGYGVISSHSVELVSITSGFVARVTPAGSGQVRVRIEPWMRNLQAGSTVDGKTEILLDLGSTTAPRQAPGNQAPVRLNATPAAAQTGAIEIAGAATELTVPLGETITIMAHEHEAELLGQALLSGGSRTGSSKLLMQLRIEQR